jgi:hypothetical protein
VRRFTACKFKTGEVSETTITRPEDPAHAEGQTPSIDLQFESHLPPKREHSPANGPVRPVATRKKRYINRMRGTAAMRRTHSRSWNAELRNQPPTSRHAPLGDAAHQDSQLLHGETVEEKNEWRSNRTHPQGRSSVHRLGKNRTAFRAHSQSAKPRLGQRDHALTHFHRIHPRQRITFDKLSRKTPVDVAQQQCIAHPGHLPQIIRIAVFPARARTSDTLVGDTSARSGRQFIYPQFRLP